MSAPAPSPADDAAAETPARPTAGTSAAVVVAAGIFLSRVIGFVRERAVGFFFGVGEHADVFRVALRMPNLLQNLLGEGTVSAAFIPVYSRLLEEGRAEDAGRFAGAILGLLAATVAALVALGLLLAAPLTALLAPGFLGDAARVAAGEAEVDRFRLTVLAVRYTFPMAGVLVLSAWALGVLNSHRRFFLPYVAPVLWNVAILAALTVAASRLFDDPLGLGALEVVPTPALNELLFAGLLGAAVGGVLQFGVQLPAVARVLRGFRLSLSTRVEGVRESLRAFGPVLAGRGVYQLSGYLDIVLAGFLAAGAIAALASAQVLYLLPISLFAMSVAASELPELSRLAAAPRADFLARVDRSVRQIGFLVVPTTVAYLGFGYFAVATLYQTGRFGEEDTWLVTFVLGAYALGLVATATSRLLQNAFYALSDTKTPAVVAAVRVAASLAAGAALMLALDRVAVADVVTVPTGERPLRLGAVGLALGASLGAWVELLVLRRALRRRVEGFGLPWRRLLRMLGLSGLAAIPAAALAALAPADALPVWLRGLAVLGTFGGAYLALGAALGFEEARTWTGRFARRLAGRRTKG